MPRTPGALVIALALLAACTRDRPKEEPAPLPALPKPIATASPVPVASVPVPPPSPTTPACPSAGPCRVLPLGDSITLGAGGSPGGYRVPLYRALRAAKVEATFVGRLKSGPTTVDTGAFPLGHEGYSGYTIEACGGRPGLAPLVESALAVARPHVVLLMVGTNDVATGCDLEASAAALERLVSVVEHAAPDATLVLANLVPTQDEALDARAADYDARIAKLVSERAAHGQKIRFADMLAAFRAVPGYRTALLSDALHPNDAGYAVMAKTWAAAMGVPR